MKQLFLTLLTCFSLFQIGCKSKKWTTPNDNNLSDPEFPIQKTIAELRSGMGTTGAKEIKENIIISGVVIADDRSGNFYKQIIIDDGTAAIPILLDAYNLYNDYPIGRKIFVKCKGLFTGFYYKLPQLGFTANEKGSLSPIPFYLWDTYLIKGSVGNKIIPIEVSIADAMKAKPELYNRLIKIKEAQIIDTLAAPAYALPASLSSATNIQLMNCDSNIILWRNSGFAKFQSYKPPYGKGTITAIYTVYNNTPQLMIRDTADVQLKSARCF